MHIIQLSKLGGATTIPEFMRDLNRRDRPIIVTDAEFASIPTSGVLADEITELPFAFGASSGEQAAIKGFYYSGTVSVTVPAITDPDIAKVDVSLASALVMQPAVGDAVIAIPLEALPTNARLQGAWINSTDQVQITFGSEGGNVVSGAKNFGFLVIDLT